MATRIVHLDDPTGAHAKAPRRTITPTKPTTGVAAKTERGVPSLTGILAPGLGARLLTDLFVEERSGRLVFDAPLAPLGTPANTSTPPMALGRATLFFLGGEPVHASYPGAIDALMVRLDKRGLLSRNANPFVTAPVSSSNPLAALARRSHPVAVLEALRDEVRELATKLLRASFGEWVFFQDEDFAESTPLTAVNPFGFILDEKRRSLAPDALLRAGEELASLYPEPKSGFANVSLRLRAFTGGVDVASVVDGTRTAADLYRVMGLDPIIGGLVLRTLDDTGLIALSPTPRPSTLQARRRHTNRMPALVQTDAKQLSQLASLPGRGGAEILSLYLEIKPERSDEMILGVPAASGPAVIERGYQQRLAELDPRAIPSGANRPYLLARAEELRAKVERAYRGLSTSTRSQHAAYEVFERIGEGGMAEVFRGRASDDPKKLVAVKRILPKLRDDPDFARQFLDEARLARRIQHPNVVRIYTVGKSGDDLYLAMELVDGLDLGELVRRAHKNDMPVPIEVACRIIADASGGLHAAHTARDRAGELITILHRDVSTQNILVGKNGDVKLTDFGIAKALASSSEGAHEQAEEHDGRVQGKVPYLAPELLDGHPASVRSDVYAMAMSLYAVLARLPFAKNDSFRTMRAILHDTLPLASSLRSDVPPAIDGILARAAARNPEERHASAQELQLELEEFLARRGSVDVGAWVRALTSMPVLNTARPATPRPISALIDIPTKTVPIFDADVSSPF